MVLLLTICYFPNLELHQGHALSKQICTSVIRKLHIWLTYEELKKLYYSLTQLSMVLTVEKVGIYFQIFFYILNVSKRVINFENLLKKIEILQKCIVFNRLTNTGTYVPLTACNFEMQKLMIYFLI